MEINKLVEKTKSDFNNAICLIGIIPFLVFLYLLVVKIGSFDMLSGEIGYIFFTAITVSLTGILVGRKILLVLIQKLIERNKLATISETVLTLGHEINNPLMVVMGNLELLGSDFVESHLPTAVSERLGQIKNHCERIRQVVDKLSHLSKPVLTSIQDDTKMIDLGKSD